MEQPPLKKRRLQIKALENRLYFDAAAVAAIANAIIHFDAQDPTSVINNPETGITPDLDVAVTDFSTIGGGGHDINENIFARAADALFAIDVSFPAAAPTGALFEWGGSGRGTYVGFDGSGDFVARAGYGGGGFNANEAALIRVDPAADLLGKTGTLYVEVNMTSDYISVWFKEGGGASANPLIHIGTDYTDAGGDIGGGSDQWSGGDNGGVGITQGSVAGGETSAPNNDFNGTITQFRYYDSQQFSFLKDLAADPSDGALNNAGINTSITLDANAFGTGRAGLDFTSASNALTLQNSNDVNVTGGYTDKSFAFVFKTGGAITTDQIIYEQGGTTNAYGFAIVDADGAGPGLDYHLYAYAYQNLSDNPVNAGNDEVALIDLGIVAPDTIYQVTAIHDANNFSASVNGGALTTLVGVLPAMLAHTGTPSLGGNNDSTLHPLDLVDLGTEIASSVFEGYIGEFYSWNTALSAGEQTSVYNYYHSKWFNTAPTSTDNTVTALEDTPLSLTAANFNFSDADGGSLSSVRIDTLPGAGTLFVDANGNNVVDGGEAVSASDVISLADITAGRLKFLNATDANGAGYTSFTFTVNDGIDFADATSTMTIDVTPQNDSPNLVISNGNTVHIDFNDYAINGYWGGQDGAGGHPTVATVSPDGSQLTIQGNAWKYIDLPYTVNANTVLTFEFRADVFGEIQGIAFDTNTDGGSLSGFQLEGGQNWANVSHAYDNYVTGSGWVEYTIPVGTFFTGAYNHLVFFADDDMNGANDSQFRNISIYDTTAALTVNEGSDILLPNTNLSSLDVDDSGAGITFTASNYTNGHITVNGVIQNSFTQADLDANLVRFVHDGSETTIAGFDVSVADGGEHGATASTGRFDLFVNPQNDGPSITTNSSASVTEGANVTFTNANLNFTDPDDVATDVTYNASNVQNGYIEVNMVAQNTFTQDDINNNRVVFFHDGTETNGTFDISLADGGEHGATPDTASVIVTRINVNDVPTDITLSNNNVNEEADTGTVVGILATEDIDVPSDNFTYTLINNPGNLFSISGGQLVVNANLDYETATSHVIRIQTDDGNGGTFERDFTVNIQDVREFTLRQNILPEAKNNTGPKGFAGIKIEEDRRLKPAQDTLIHSFANGQAQDQANAFYGRENVNQIIRENTTFEISQLLDTQTRVESSSETASTADNFVIPDSLNGQGNDLNNNDLLKGDIQIPTIREVLEALQTEQDDQISLNNDGRGSIENTFNYSRQDNPLYDQFENVLSYHEKRKNELIEALSKDV